MADKYDNPRAHSNENPFVRELGVELPGDEEEPPVTDTGSGYPNRFFQAKNKKRIKLSLWDNMEVPGSAYIGRDRSQSPGEMAGGMGEVLQRSTDDQPDYTEIDRMPEDFPEDPRPNPNTQQGTDYVDEEVAKLSPKLDELMIQVENVTANTRRKPMDFKKIAAEKDKRLARVYEIEEDYAAYGRYCGEPTCVGIWKELLGFEQRRALKLERQSECWKCPKCGKVTSALGSTAEQTSGFSALNTYNSLQPADDADDFSPVDSIKPDKERRLR